VFEFTKNATSVNAMEDDMEVVGLVREATIVIEDVRAFPTTSACSNAYRLRRRMKSRWVPATIIWRRSKDTPKSRRENK